MASRVHRWMVPAALLARPLLLLLLASYRLRIVGEGRLEALLDSGEPAIFTSWHSRLFATAWLVVQRLKRRRRRLAVLVSLSRDGELGARMSKAHGLEVVRGSTSRGALSGLMKLYRVMSRSRLPVFAAPDGPRGPARKAKPGTLLLARMTGAPVLPLAYAARPVWRLGSWDRLMLPKPFARVVVAIGEPLRVEPGDSDEELRRATAELEARLDSLVEQAEAVLDGPGGGRRRNR